MDHYCLDCSTLVKGRADKKFCGDICRNNYHNQLKASDYSFINSVNQILKKNRNILKTKNPAGKLKVKRDELLIRGFDFNFHTYTYTTKKGQTYFFCYDYGYFVLENEYVVLVNREEK